MIKPTSRHRPLWHIALGVISACMLMLLQHTHRLTPLENTFHALVAPLYTWSDQSHRGWSGFLLSNKQLNLLEEQNARLRAELLLLRARMRHLENLKSENQQLMSLLRSSITVPGRVEVAKVMSVDLHQASSDFVIDKGKKNQVYLGQPVLDGYGVVGQVVKVMGNQSLVRDLRDLHSGIPVAIERNHLRGIVSGEGMTEPLKLDFMTNTDDVKLNDTLITSGLGEQFPAGYPVGTVSHVSGHQSHAFLDIDLTPLAHLDRFRQVLLVWPSKPRIKRSQ